MDGRGGGEVLSLEFITRGDGHVSLEFIVPASPATSASSVTAKGTMAVKQDDACKLVSTRKLLKSFVPL